MRGDIRIGISGWRYAPWRGDFYPKGLVQKRELFYASRTVNTIEINGSFYALQKPEYYANWGADTPDDFVFSVKAPRYITHVKRLRDIEQPLANFFASGIFQLKNKLGPILWQFPPSFRFDAELFRHFLQMLPRTGKEAKACARHCNERMVRENYLDIPLTYRLRHAVEIRHPTFESPDFVALLREFNVALVVADTAGKWPYAEDLTSDFVYLRLHGDAELYTSGYSESALTRWCTRISAWSTGSQPEDAHLIDEAATTSASGSEAVKKVKGPRRLKTRDVYCYFDNDVKVRAPYDARRLLEKLQLTDRLTIAPGKAMEVEP